MTEDVRLSIRPAKQEDIDLLFIWRNDQETREMSLETTPVTRQQHQKWFENIMSSERNVCFLGSLNDQSFGVCRFKNCNNNLSAEVSISIDSQFRGQGLGSWLLFNSVKKFRTLNKKTEVNAIIRKKNEKSLKMFQRINFEIIDESDSLYTLQHR